MASVTPASPFGNFSGKLNRDECIVMRTRNGKTQAYTIQHPYNGPLTENRQKVVSAFTQAVQQCKLEMADPVRLAYWQSEFTDYRREISRHPKHNEKIYSTLRGFIIAQLSKQIAQLSKQIAQLPPQDNPS